jgi:hypothetical protein
MAKLRGVEGCNDALGEDKVYRRRWPALDHHGSGEGHKPEH